jgi:signal transduction histidine kinase
MKRSADFSSQWIFYLVAGCYFGAVFLRSILVFRDSPALGMTLGLLLAGLVLSACEPAISRRWKLYFPIYLLAQVLLIFLLMVLPGSVDFFAVLFVIPTMLIMLRLDAKIGWAWIGFCTLLTILLLARNYKSEAIGLTLIYTAANVFFGAYALATRRAQAERDQNHVLAQELQAANHQLSAYSTQLERLAVAQERNQMARELHDSVTQAVFSMTLATQSALLLLERNPSQVGEQLDRLSLLGQGALSELQLLISKLPPETETSGGLLLALRQHLADRQLKEGLSVSLEIEGDQALSAAEEQGLFRIAQEALNNIVKHAHTSQAQIWLHLANPFWMEVSDQGQGFDLEQARSQGRVGLQSMRERAIEIGWELQITTSPGAGTRIRVEKLPARDKQVDLQ